MKKTIHGAGGGGGKGGGSTHTPPKPLTPSLPMPL
ncbi:hypothetical protein Psal134_03519 (plasmid) [Piscirickettsia salmonis]|nr:hypothetical protein Psal134_03519 [Piscirickettsia salmonis]